MLRKTLKVVITHKQWVFLSFLKKNGKDLIERIVEDFYTFLGNSILHVHYENKKKLL